MTELEKIALLTEHRIHALEEQAVGARQVERDVDHLKIHLSNVEQLLVAHQAESRQRDEHNRASLGRLHQRLDLIQTADAREEGREAGENAERTRTLKLVAWTVTTTIAASGVLVAVAAVLLSH